ncbi:MAG TPA: tetratricopeptide repeat protein [Armatimonadota bacterium]|nr:tetratricopeptide repeat protein [Armatimonadota bacterium]
MAAGVSARDQGLQLLREGSIGDSVGFLLKAIVEDPSDVDLYLYLAFAYTHQDDLDKAIHILEQATDVAPASAKVHYNLGVAYHRADNTTQAKDEYLRALGLDPTYTAAEKALDSLAPEGGQPAAESGPPEA